MATNNSLNNSSTANFSSNSFLAGYATTATAAGTTTLTVNSAQLQYFTGTTTQTVLLPVTSTLVLGQSFTIVNNSTGVVTVQSSGSNTIQAMAAATELVVTCILTSGTTAASWSAAYIGGPASSATNIAGGAANDLVYQTAASTTGFITPAYSSVLVSNQLQVPSWSAYVPAQNILTDNVTVEWKATTTSIGSAVATGTSPYQLTSYSISGTAYISTANYSANTFSTYAWNGTAFASIGSAISTGAGTNPYPIIAYQIGGTQYLSMVLAGNLTLGTYSWNGSTFVAAGTFPSVGNGAQSLCAYVISGTTYITVANRSDNTISTYSWSGTAFTQVGSAVSTGSSTLPGAIAQFAVSGTQYVVTSNNGTGNMGLYSWNGSAYVQVGSNITVASSISALTAYTINGSQYVSVLANTTYVYTYIFNGTTLVQTGTQTQITAGQDQITNFTYEGGTYLAVSLTAPTNALQVLLWNGTNFVSISSATAGNTTSGITAYTIGSTPYISVSNQSANTFSTFTFGQPYLYSPAVLTLDGNGGVATPASGVITIAGTAPIATLASGSTLTVSTTAISTINATTGGANASSNTITIVGSGGIATSGSGSTITISGSGISIYPYTNVTASTQTFVVNTGYVSNDGATQVTFLLPSTATVGQVVAVQGAASGLWTIHQNSGQTIHFNAVSSTTGTGGSVTSTSQYDSIMLMCITTNTDWAVVQSTGNLSVV